MLRFIIRSIGLIVLALGFVGIVLDGTRSMANASVMFTSLYDLGNALFPLETKTFVSGIQISGPISWTNVTSVTDIALNQIMHLPASMVGFVLGALLLKMGQKPHEPDIKLQSHLYG